MTHRTHILETANNLITGSRESEYGSPWLNFQNIADRWSQHLGIDIEAYQVALMMADLKIARLVTSNRPHEDSLIDICGYAALAAELSDAK
tara:strand:- start:112 stop:384 length:273 start_codon:yes stop_codon:yes gene_type:complete